MEVIIVENPQAVAALVADAVCRLLTDNRHAVLGLATGSTPTLTYNELVERADRQEVDFTGATVFMLDEYLGLQPDDPNLYLNQIRSWFTDRVNIPRDHVLAPDSGTDDVKLECQRYEERIAEEGGIELQLLGIGSDGHIAFNEPTSSLASRTRIKTLTEQSRVDNAMWFSSVFDGDDTPNSAIERVPCHVITQGVGTILDASHIVLLATGSGKADAIARAIEGPVTAMVPASAMQLHPHATVVVDEEAATGLQLADYYRTVHAEKVHWQPPIT